MVKEEPTIEEYTGQRRPLFTTLVQFCTLHSYQRLEEKFLLSLLYLPFLFPSYLKVVCNPYSCWCTYTVSLLLRWGSILRSYSQSPIAVKRGAIHPPLINKDTACTVIKAGTSWFKPTKWAELTKEVYGSLCTIRHSLYICVEIHSASVNSSKDTMYNAVSEIWEEVG